nr:NADH-quinone oxidoreductase subunit L [Desulfobacterales bacterium]
MISNTWLIPFFPFLGFLINGLMGSRLSKKIVGLIGCVSVGLSFLYSGVLFILMLSLPAQERIWQPEFYVWVSAGKFLVKAAFLIDPLSMIMMLVVSGVGFLIHIYSIGYMHEDPAYARYFAYLNLFAASMLVLVMANNFLVMFVGWEGVGLCSYLLIGFWYEKKSASDAGKKAFVVNRVGDFGFLLAIFLTYWTFSTLNFNEVTEIASHRFHVGDAVITAICLLLFLGAVGKSAQIPLYVWLPDAMEGPTPVSALIHAATMVTAGVYMVARCNVLYLLSPISMAVVATVGCVTAIYAASIGLMQNDIKRVLAYSTVSQLGYMFLACGVGAFTAGIFHLMTHAFFKALLFLGSGSVIHALAGEQDMRRMGGLRDHLPRTYWTFIAGTLAIAGIFPFAGFFSKDEILWESFIKGNVIYWFVAVLAAFMTAFYMFRLVFMTFHGESRIDASIRDKICEAPMTMLLPLTVLAILSLIGGFIGIPIIKRANLFHEFLGPIFGKGMSLPEIAHSGSASIAFEISLMVISLAVALCGIWLAYLMYIKDTELPDRLAARFSRLYNLVHNKYYVDEIYDALVVNPIKYLSSALWLIFDNRIVDGIVNGTAWVCYYLSVIIRRIQTGYVYNYALGILVGVCLILGYVLLI